MSIALSAQWQWAKMLPTPHSGIQAVGAANGNIFINTRYLNTNYVAHHEILKLDTSANILQKLVLPNNLQVGRIAVSQQNFLYVVGGFDGTLSIANTTVASVGSLDAVILCYNQNFQLQWVKSFGDSLFDGFNSIQIDKGNRLYITGMFCSKISFGNLAFKGSKTGTSFISRFDANGNCQKIVLDSTNEQTKYAPYAYIQDVSINDKGEIMTLGSFDEQDFYFIGGHSISVPPPWQQSSNWGYSIGIKFDQDLNFIGGKCIKQEKWHREYFMGHNNNNMHVVAHGGYMEGYSQIKLLGDTGNTVKMFSGFEYAQFLGYVDDEPYFLDARHYYDQDGGHFPISFLVQQNDTMTYIDQLEGEYFYGHKLIKISNGGYFLIGVNSEWVSINGNKILSDSARTVIIKIGSKPLTAGFRKVEKGLVDFKLFPNPSDGKVSLLSESCDLREVRVRIFNSVGCEVTCTQQLMSNILELDFADQSPGIYFLKVSGVKSEGVFRFVRN
jgi:hypothetical protein